MKRFNNLYDKICDINNINIADNKASKCKSKNKWVKRHLDCKDSDNLKLSESLQNMSYKTSKYRICKIYEPKERVIYKLPYYPDRIVHHAIMNILEPILIKTFIANTYCCIKGRGIRKASDDLYKSLQDKEGTTYCLKLDIKQYYASIDHDILKQKIRKKIKDKKLLILLDNIIDSAPGVPIGNYLSQFFANLYLTDFDHWAKEKLKLKYYFRYCDDIVILHNNKQFLHDIFIQIKEYMSSLKLEIKNNYQIFPVDKRGIDFLGYKFYHTHVFLRKRIKFRILKLVRKYKESKISYKYFINHIIPYFGWLKYCNSKYLLKRIEKDTGLEFSNWRGKEVAISSIYNIYIKLINISEYKNKWRLEFIHNSKPKYCFTTNLNLKNRLLLKPLPAYIKISNNERSKKNNNFI